MLARIVFAVAALAAAALAQDHKPSPINKVRPAYPPEAKEAKITGLVTLAVDITADGKVADVRVSSGHPLLAASAVEAVRQWEFEPAQKDGARVAATADINVNFTLEENPPDAMQVPGAEQQRRLVRQPKPAYPPDAKAQGISGKVRLRAIIDKAGMVRSVEVLSGEPMLVEASVEAVRQWQYEPTILNGEAVDVVTDIDVNFTLSR